MSKVEELHKRKSKLQIAGTACSNCRKTSKEAGVKILLRCTRCRMSYYCSKNCQKADFPGHKQFCQALCELSAKEEAWKLCDGDETEWNKRVIEHMHLLDEALDRPLTDYEKNSLLYQPKCQVCLISAVELKSPQKLIPCLSCMIISCCSEAHWKIHRPKHQKLCQTYKNMIECENVIYKLMGETAWAQEEWDESRTFPPLPKDWQTYFEWRNAPKFSESFLSVVTNSLSPPLTILAAIERFYTRDELHALDELIIHLIGASQYEIMSLSSFEEIMHVLPNVKVLRLILVGLELPNKTTPAGISMKCCSRCEKENRKRICALFPTSYHEHAEQPDDYIKPHIAVGFNTGLYETDTEHWEPTVKYLLDKDTPCVFTSYSKEEAAQDLQALKDWGAKIISGNKENKWKSIVPLIEPQVLDKFFYNNYYRTLFRGNAS
ncbi:479_t:CDS:1 [Ambispora leptoticha]|uniref:479_t:CDS:1 n=1 Tax=Ambispora leptoticha TaxID=144679 RepID=A0A9N8W4Q8_9GLOM|nr:479_t:CDS:1 [Ambispora leptoticha]